MAAHRSRDKDDARPPRKLILLPADFDLAIPRYPNPGRECVARRRNEARAGVGLAQNFGRCRAAAAQSFE